MRILYVATNFASLTHTFIAREVSALRRLGVSVDLLALRQASGAVAARPECDVTGCRYVYPVAPATVFLALLKLCFTRPGRLFTGVRTALGSSHDSWRNRLKMLYQLAVSASRIAEVERVQPDLIHAHLANPPGSYAMFLSALTGVPFSFTGHAADLFRRPVGNGTKLRRAVGAVAISRFNLEHYKSLHPDLDEAEIIHCGVDLSEFPFAERRQCGTPLRVLAVGRATEKKGFRYLLEALAQLERDGVAWMGHLVGGGPQLEELRQRADRLGLTALEITGALQIDEVKGLLAAADVFVLPCIPADDGDVDGIPVALMEAMANGCPVISTRVSGVAELLADGAAGLLVDPCDAGAVATAMKRIVADDGLTQAMSRAGRVRIESEFDVDVEARKLRAFFERISQGDRG
ncbi:MAG: glycosyltransferase family 4 protein [bacterium]|nr:glycosyltransferase family 4 protein [bacterium]